MTYDQIVQEIENLFEALQDIFIAALIRFGPYIVASIPAIFTGTSVSATYGTLIGSVVGIGLEVTVLLSVYAASSLYDAAKSPEGDDQKLMSKFWFMVWLFPFYFIGIALAILYPTSTGLGLVAPILTIICYIAGMFIREVGKERKRMTGIEADKNRDEVELSKVETEHKHELERIELDKKHELERLALEQKHTERMARIEAKKEIKPVRNSAKKRRISKTDKREISLSLIKKLPTISGAELGRQLGASPRTGQNILNEFEQAGVIHRNGDGWKVN